jgi:hypothetical protein
LASTITVLACAAILGALVACGGGGTPAPPPLGSTAVQVNLGDAPADWMLAFSTSITSMTLNGSKGTVTVAPAATPLELIHRIGIMQPLAVVSAPQGTYTSASITLGSCTITYIDPATKAITQTSLSGPFPATVTFDSPLTVASTPLEFNFDLDLSRSVSGDTSGNFSFTPQFHFSMGALGAGNGAGGMQQMIGSVSSVASGYFVMTALQAAQSFTIMTNTATQFHGVATDLSTLAPGMGVVVTANPQANGTFLATQVGARMRSGGIMGGGIITEVTGTPATQLSIVMQNGAGASLMPAYLSQSITVNIAPDTQFSVDDDRVDLSNLPFTPIFDASHIYAGQSVMPVNASGGLVPGNGMGGNGITNAAGTIAASSIYLEEQGFRGVTDTALTAGTATSFTLTLTPDSAFTTLTGASTILVHQQTGTNIEANGSIAEGATVRVHGLLFQNAGQWTLVASTIAAD